MQILLCCLCIPLSATASAQEVEQYYEDAVTRFESREYDAALIQLKNALQVDPQHLPSLELVGDVYMALSQPGPAEVAFDDALLLGGDRDRLALKLARAYLQQNSHRVFLDRLPAEGVSEALRAELLGMRAQAYAALQRDDQAQAALAEALSIDPHAVEPNLFRIRRLVLESRATEALQVARSLAQSAPDNPRAWEILGQVQEATGSTTDAMESYDRALGLDEGLLSARLRRGGLHLIAGRLEAAEADLEYLEAFYAIDPRVHYYRGLLEDARGNSEAAMSSFRECATTLSAFRLPIVARHGELTRSGAICHLRLNEPESARQYLETYRAQTPGNAAINRLLANLYLDQRESQAAVRLLDGMLEAEPDDTSLLRMLSQAYRLAGDEELMARHFRRALIVEAGEESPAARLAFDEISAGNINTGLAKLESLAEDSPELPTVRKALVITYLSQGRPTLANKHARRLLSSAPDNVEYLNMMTTILLREGKTAEARHFIDTILESDAQNLGANTNLARLYMQSDDYDQARSILNRLSAGFPDSADLRFALALLESEAGNPAGAIQLTEPLVMAYPGWLEARIFLVELYGRMGDWPGAIAQAREAAGRHDDSLAARLILASTLSRSGQTGEARGIYMQLAREPGLDATSLYLVAQRQIGLGALSDGKTTLRRTLELDPEHLEARAAQVGIFLAEGDATAARVMAESLRSDHPQAALSHATHALVLMNLGRNAEALNDFRQASAIDPEAVSYRVGEIDAAIRLGKVPQVDQVLFAVVEDFPDSLTVRERQVRWLAGQERWRALLECLDEVREIAVDKAVFMAYRARALLETGDPGALAVAEAAYRIDPNSALVNDALGWVLVGRGRASEGIPYLRHAVARSAREPSYRYHLAVALSELDRVKEASAELELALAGEGAFYGRDDAQKLWAELQ
jgi:putative PEP-CTERM system TPR-repeat lipoprotein